MSLVESTTNTALSFVLGVLAQMVVFYLYDIHVTLFDNVSMVCIFTLISFARNYVVRRFFSRRNGSNATSE